MDPYAFLMLKPEADGSITRLGSLPESLPSADLSSSPFHLSKDITINQSNNTWARVFVPRQAFDDQSTTPTKKFPVIVYFRPGGFVVFGAATSLFDSFYQAISTQVPAVIVSVDFRNAPEYRLPAAYDDCLEALRWIKSSEDEWLTKFADMTKCFLMGSSAGGNITYKLGLQVADNVDEFKPIEIKGLIMHHPFIGGVERSDSELRLADDKVAPLCLTDVLWELSLPVGEDRDHEFCNLIKGIKPKMYDEMKKLGYKILMIAVDGDPMFDRQMELLKKLKENGVEVVSKVDVGRGLVHCHDLFDPVGANNLSKLVKHFVAF